MLENCLRTNEQSQKVYCQINCDLCIQAYAAGCNIVILANNFERVQIIPGAVHNYIRISCLDCSTDTGKIAAAYENQVCIFEPTPLIHSTCSHVRIDTFPYSCIFFNIYLRTRLNIFTKSFLNVLLQQLEYRWVQTGSLQTESNITSLSWNLEGTRLLTGGELLQLWHQNIMPFQEEHSKFILSQISCLNKADILNLIRLSIIEN